MPDEDLEQLAVSIQEGVDQIEVPEELVEEPEKKPTEPERRTLQVRIREMSTGERLKLAMRGNREARAILIKDTSLMVRRYVMVNPRISEEEVIQLARNRQVDRELLEMIWRNNEWVNNYQVRLALVKNPKTPIQISLKYISTLMVRDLRLMAKSKNIPTAVNSAAKRMILRGSVR